MTEKGETANKKSTRQLRRVARILSEAYGNPRHHNKDDPLDELVFILLSAKTTERSYLKTYETLKSTFPNWFSILDAAPGSVARLITAGGLSRKKEAQLRALLMEIQNRTGKPRLSLVAKLRGAEAERFLSSLPGVGLKSARCVLMYSLGRAVFPVDTHCRRVLSRLGLISFRRLTDNVQNEIQSGIPSDLRYSLHVNLVAHGREVCRARNPLCSQCRLSQYCEYYRRSNWAGQSRDPRVAMRTPATVLDSAPQPDPGGPRLTEFPLARSFRETLPDQRE